MHCILNFVYSFIAKHAHPLIVRIFTNRIQRTNNKICSYDFIFGDPFYNNLTNKDFNFLAEFLIYFTQSTSQKPIYKKTPKVLAKLILMTVRIQSGDNP